jgi:hypothetical protein
MAPEPAAGQLMAAPPLSVEGIAAFGWASHQTTRYRGAGAGCTSDYMMSVAACCQCRLRPSIIHEDRAY